MVIGHARKYVTALIEIDHDAVADWARSRDIAYTGFTSLAEHAEVRKLFEAEIGKANASLARVEQVKTFRILPRALDPEEEGEPVTPTRKVKRTLMLERFKPLVESMYDEREERLVAREIGQVLT
jgi:long-chain acyl-CoA synthetase